MDLRGFTSANTGCVFELQTLAERAALAKVLFVVDVTTELHAVRRALLQGSERVRPGFIRPGAVWTAVAGKPVDAATLVAILAAQER